MTAPKTAISPRRKAWLRFTIPVVAGRGNVAFCRRSAARGRAVGSLRGLGSILANVGADEHPAKDRQEKVGSILLDPAVLAERYLTGQRGQLVSALLTKSVDDTDAIVIDGFLRVGERERGPRELQVPEAVCHSVGEYHMLRSHSIVVVVGQNYHQRATTLRVVELAQLPT